MNRFLVVFAVTVLLFVACNNPANNKTVNNTSFTDSRDDQVYRTVVIGGQKWMVENLNYIADSSWCYDDEISNCAIYGRLYTWGAAMKACPVGWRLPANTDWDDLVAAVGDSSVAGGKLKSKTGWSDKLDGSSSNGSDDYGFSALPGGNKMEDSSFGGIGEQGSWWSAKENGNDFAWAFGMNDDNAIAWYKHAEYVVIDDSFLLVYDYGINKDNGLSVRCIMDMRP
ncbi:MAG: fibrobacter succinogenes major paralogous domain-containing protein [Chitinispirillia bacterium]|nr:fibrobacter succinogenes major paralogous domain-containing protein [Chitinispirillia bacterium]